MSTNNTMRQELQDIEQKLRSARKAAAAPQATERDKADLKLIEQEYLAAENKARRAETGSSGKAQDRASDEKKKLDKDLDEALKGTFPGSDPVSFVQAAPVKEEDRALPAVKVAEQQQPEKTQAAKDSASRPKRA
jgi:hypothetical protein